MLSNEKKHEPKKRVRERTEDKRRAPMPRDRYVTGVFAATTRGFGFLEIEDREEDLFVPEGKTLDAFPGDLVQARLLRKRHGKKREGEITAILERRVKTLVGTFQKSRDYGFIVPDDPRIPLDIFVPLEASKKAADGQKVAAELVSYGEKGKSPEGAVTEILGYADEPGVDIACIAKAYDLPGEFPERVRNQAERVAKPVSEADRKGRMDLRALDMVTIDGEDAKDLDDAVSLTMEEDLYCLGVHIADVTNYVQENSALDREALSRGTSVYLADRVIPMLPTALSNGICSLNAGEDRLALSCLMKIDKDGRVRDYRIAESVIRVNRRMSYTEVQRILEEEREDKREDPLRKKEGPDAEYERLVFMLRQMTRLAEILRRKRKERGSVDFDFPEAKIVLDEYGRPTEIKPYERNAATKLIEDFMLIANETVAQHFFWQELPFVYRTHENPDPEKIRKLAAFIRNFGYSIKLTQEEIHPMELQKLLAKADGSDEEALIGRLTLRSMKQAKYTTENTGHFGLACPCYCHFTSPIRRYPDLQIHRIIKEQLRGRLREERIEHYNAILQEVAKQSSRLERRADEAERETDKLKKAQYMEERIGECYEGVISGVTAWGVYVELENTVEGMIRVSDLPSDFYIYDEKNYEIVGERTHKAYKLGKKLTIVVKEVDLQNRTIDFGIPEA